MFSFDSYLEPNHFQSRKSSSVDHIDGLRYSGNSSYTGRHDNHYTNPYINNVPDLFTPPPRLCGSRTLERQSSSDSDSSGCSDISATATIWTSSADLTAEPEDFSTAENSEQAYGNVSIVNAGEQFEAVPPASICSRATRGHINHVAGPRVHGPAPEKHGILSKTSHEARCLCGKRYTGKYAGTNLMKHLRYIEEGPFLCDHCFKPFKQADNLKAHIKKHIKVAQDAQFQCTECWKAFKRFDDLERHMQNDHRTTGL